MASLKLIANECEIAFEVFTPVAEMRNPVMRFLSVKKHSYSATFLPFLLRMTYVHILSLA